MKKIFGLLFLILILSSCGEKPCETQECFQAQIEMQKLKEEQRIEREKREQEAIEKQRAYELEKMKIEASKPIETKQIEVIQEGNESLEYMKNSQQVRDVVEGAAIGYGIFKILTD